MGDASPVLAQERLDINRASARELESLPGIGPVRAEAIVSYRKEHGYFEKPEDLKHVKGIGPKTFEKLKDRIEAGPP